MANNLTPSALHTQVLEPPNSRRIDLLAMHHAWPKRYPFLLESCAESGHMAAPIARYDMLLLAADEHIVLRQPGEGSGFLDELNAWQRHELRADIDSDLPFVGGWFLYLGYELAAEIEYRLSLPEADSELPTALAVRCPAAIICDRLADSVWLVAETPQLLAQLQADIARVPEPRETEPFMLRHLEEENPGPYLSAVERIKEYILAGDVFQVNLSRGWQADIDESVTNKQIYHQLRQANPAPFAGLMSWRDSAVFSSSPERLVEVKGRRVQTRPIAGTRPRSRRQQTDQTERNALVAHPKERAEHIMLIDLERNDLGRICEAGSVEVNELMVLESYAHVHHIVSNVTGQLREDVPAGDIIRAVFPGGTITGCPKVRCMEIIA